MRTWIAILVLMPLLSWGSYLSAQEGGTNPPRKVVTQVSPSYPDAARRLKLGGIVRIQAVVAPNGTVKSTSIIGGSPLLGLAAEDAVLKWKFAAGKEETKELVILTFNP
jgi:TonB family protein